MGESALQDRWPALKVLQVSAFFPAHGGGIEAVAGQLASRLAASGIQMRWMAGGAAAEAPPPADWPGVAIHWARSVDPLERRVGLPAPLWSPGSVVALWRAVGWADLVHIHDYLYMPSMLAACFARWRRRPLVVTQHIGEIPFGSAWARRLLRTLNRSVGASVLGRADQVVFVGRPVMATFSAFTAFRAPAQLLPNGIDHERYRPLPRTQPDPDAPVSLLFVGRFVEKKGLQLIRPLLPLAGARWSFIGWGPLPPAVASSPEVQLLGRLPSAAIVPHYQQADLLVLPSSGEGFPLVVQEALACGTPVLVSREVAQAFPTSDPRCVFDVELRVPDPERALAQALKALVADRQRLYEARDAAVALAAQWSWERCVDAYRGIYDRVLSRLPP